MTGAMLSVSMPGQEGLVGGKMEDHAVQPLAEIAVAHRLERVGMVPAGATGCEGLGSHHKFAKIQTN